MVNEPSSPGGRIPLRFDPGLSPSRGRTALVLGWAEPAPAWAVAVERLPLHASGAPQASGAPSAASGPSCGCVACAPRGAVAEALRRLFLRSMRGQVKQFDRVVVLRPPQEAALAWQDAFVASRFTPED